MIGYTMFASDMQRTLQDCADLVVRELPTSSAPEGFTWKPVINVHETKDDLKLTLDWVAKPNADQ